MKFKTLKNREIRLDILPERFPVRSRQQSPSQGQYALGRTILSLYGHSTLMLEEFSIPEERLYIDFYLPHHNLAFEFQGEQHDKFNKFFHKNKEGFEQSKTRDQRKEEWCKLNNITLVKIYDIPTPETLLDFIKEARKDE